MSKLDAIGGKRTTLLILGANSPSYCIHDQDCKALVDTLISHAVTGNVNEIHAHIIDSYSGSPFTLTGASTLCHVTEFTANGMTPFAYLLQQAHANGIKVLARLFIYHPVYWFGATTPLITPLTNNATNHNQTNGGDTINFASEAVRTAIANMIGDFVVQNPTVDGVSLDDLRTDGVVTQTTAEVNGLVAAIRAAVPMQYSIEGVGESGIEAELDSPSGGSLSHIAQDVPAWLANGWCDRVTYIGYFIKWATRQVILDNVAGYRPAVGISMEASQTTLSTWKHSLLKLWAHGYRRILCFQHSDRFDEEPFRQAVIDLYAGTLTAPQPPVSKIVVTPDTSFAITISGAEYTVTNASVADHTTEGPLKAHFEGLAGEQPALILKRPTTSTIQVHLGDWKYG